MGVEFEERSISQLLGNWKGEVPQKSTSSSIQLRTYELYHKRIAQYSVDDIRFMLIQEIGSDFLVAKALAHLEDDILVEASYYEGDLLSSLLKLNSDFWKGNEEHYKRLKKVIAANEDRLLLKLDMSLETDRALSKGIKDFNQLSQ